MLTARSTACAAALLVACASALPASDTTFVKQGQRVRLTLPNGVLVGEVTALETDTLIVITENGGSAQPILVSQIEMMEVSLGKRSNVGKGAWIGAAAGVIGGVIWGASEGPTDVCTKAGCAAISGLVLGAGGALVGLGVGAATSGERWVEAELPAPPVTLKVGTDGSVRLAFSLRL